MNYSKFLNPFTYIATTKALLLGLAGILVSAALACFGPIHLDGILDMHVGLSNISAGQYFLLFIEGLLDWLIFSCLLYTTAVILSKSKIHFVHILSTQAFARLPILIPILIGALIPLEKTSAYFLHQFGNMGPEIEDVNAFQLFLFALFMLSTLVSIIWMVIWMYKAYSTSAHIKGTKAVVSFIITLIVAEIVAKIVFLFQVQ